jgi:hypothetical protein
MLQVDDVIICRIHCKGIPVLKYFTQLTCATQLKTLLKFTSTNDSYVT